MCLLDFCFMLNTTVPLCTFPLNPCSLLAPSFDVDIPLTCLQLLIFGPFLTPCNKLLYSLNQNRPK